MMSSRRTRQLRPGTALFEHLETRICPAPVPVPWLQRSLQPARAAGGPGEVAAPAPASMTVKAADVVATGSWTIMVFMTGDDLNPFAARNINQMEKALLTLPASVHFVVSWDQPPSSVADDFATAGGAQPAWDGTGRAVLTPDANLKSITTAFDLSAGEQNTGDPATLTDFVSWAVDQAPAQHYGLVLWGHGGGLDGSQFDSESNDDSLTLAEVTTALGTAGMPTFEFTAYDACLMGMAEVGFALADTGVPWFVASQESIAANGYDYTTAFRALVTSAPDQVTPRQVVAGMVASYGRQYARQPQRLDTLSATAVSDRDKLAAALGQFVAVATNGLTAANRVTLLAAARGTASYENPAGGKSFRDLGGFMTRVAATRSLPRAVRDAATAVKADLAAIVSAKTADRRHSSGVSVFLPDSRFDVYLDTYATDASAFCQATHWDTFVAWLVAPVQVTVGPTRVPGVMQRAFATFARRA